MFKQGSFFGRQYVFEHFGVTGAKSKKVGAAFTQRHVIGTGVRVHVVDVHTTVLPKANWANEVVVSFRQGNVVATRALLPWSRIVRFVPREFVCHLAEFVTSRFARFVIHGFVRTTEGFYDTALNEANDVLNWI